MASIPQSGRCPGEGNGNPLQYSCLGNPTDRGAWRVAVHVVTKSQTWLNDSTTNVINVKALSLLSVSAQWFLVELTDFHSSLESVFWDVARVCGTILKLVPGSSSRSFLYTFYLCSPFSGLHLGTSALVPPAVSCSLFCIPAVALPLQGCAEIASVGFGLCHSHLIRWMVGWVRTSWGLGDWDWE